MLPVRTSTMSPDSIRTPCRGRSRARDRRRRSRSRARARRRRAAGRCRAARRASRSGRTARCRASPAPRSSMRVVADAVVQQAGRSRRASSASQCVAACVPISNASSLVVKSLRSPVNAVLNISIARCGLMRPGMLPVCGPSASNGIASENETPRRTAAAPRRTASGVMKFSVPRWSSGPHRPQFETRPASSCRSFDSAMRAVCQSAARGARNPQDSGGRLSPHADVTHFASCPHVGESVGEITGGSLAAR